MYDIPKNTIHNKTQTDTETLTRDRPARGFQNKNKIKKQQKYKKYKK
jgi:hypothetical protein